MAKMNRMRADLVAEIKTARAEAQTKANAFKNLTSKRYESLRAITAVATYNEVLSMIEWGGTEHKIPDMAATALSDFEYAHNDDPTATERTLAVAEGRRDALASVADWMGKEETA